MWDCVCCNECNVNIFSPQFKRFHRDVIIELEKKTEMDVKYMNVSVTIYGFKHWQCFSIFISEELFLSLKTAVFFVSRVSCQMSVCRPPSSAISQSTKWNRTSWSALRQIWRSSGGKARQNTHPSMTSKRMRWDLKANRLLCLSLPAKMFWMGFQSTMLLNVYALMLGKSI